MWTNFFNISNVFLPWLETGLFINYQLDALIIIYS